MSSGVSYGELGLRLWCERRVVDVVVVFDLPTVAPFLNSAVVGCEEKDCGGRKVNNNGEWRLLIFFASRS